MKDNLKWLKQPKKGNFKAALSYLSLLWCPHRADAMVERLKQAELTQFMAKDIFRASGLSLLGISNARIKADLFKIEKGIALSPILLVRDESRGRVVIADGYHRLCALYSFDEEAWVACHII